MTETTSPFFPRRMVHLDFHTGPDVTNVGSDFDPVAFAQTFKEAAVDSVTVFAKCHHGLLYYDTERPERHPGLSTDIHLLEQQVEALHSVGIRAPIYISVQCDEYAANTHPDWIALHDDLRQVKWADSAHTAGWQILDMSSPYQDFLAEQIQEVIDRFAPLDGIFLDMTWDQPSSSVWAKAGMLAKGLDVANPADRDRYAREVAHDYMARFQAMIEPHLNPDVASGVWFNSRPKTALGEESKYVRHVEIESLPTGGWGYAYFPYVSRFVRPLGKPTLSHTGRFYKSWGDNGGLKPHAALSYECEQILAQGMTAGVGDLLHPSGAVNPVSYDLIGSVYRYLESCEPFVENGTLVTDLAVIVDPELGDSPGAAGFGTVRALQQLRQQFDIVAPTAELSDYRLVIVPETTVIDDALAAKLTAYSAGGGSIFISRGAADGLAGADLLDFIGVEFAGDSPFSNVFIRPGDAIGGATGFDHVMYDRTIRMRPTGSTEVLASIVEPYFERSWNRFSGHEYTPTSGVVSEWAAIAQNGRTIIAAAPLLEAYGNHGAPAYRELLRASLNRLLPDPAVKTGGPVNIEATVVSTPESKVVHLISYVPTRVSDDQTLGRRVHQPLDVIEDPFPFVDVPVSVRVDHAPSAVTLEPAGENLDFTVEDGYVNTSVTVLSGHAMLVLHD
jgi:hypothetical protein